MCGCVCECFNHVQIKPVSCHFSVRHIKGIAYYFAVSQPSEETLRQEYFTIDYVVLPLLLGKVTQNNYSAHGGKQQ